MLGMLPPMDSLGPGSWWQDCVDQVALLWMSVRDIGAIPVNEFGNSRKNQADDTVVHSDFIGGLFTL